MLQARTCAAGVAACQPVPRRSATLWRAQELTRTAGGPGLTGGTANSPADFTIDTREAGPGGLGLTIEGPVEAKIECFDRGDGTCGVRYWPTEPGEYKINVLYDAKPIPGSPFKAQIEPSRRVDVSSIKAFGPGLQPGNHGNAC